MNPVNNVGQSNPVQQIKNNPIQKTVAGKSGPTLASDTVELSGQSPVEKTSSTFRADKVAAVKAAIANGTYEDDKKIDVAVDRLLGELLK